MTGVHEATGSYALDALDLVERIEFEAHLATCPTCASEVAVLSETAAELALLSLAIPPPTLRAAVLDAVRLTPELAAPDRFATTAVQITAAQVTSNGSGPASQSLRAARSSGPRRTLPKAGGPGRPDHRAEELAVRRQRRRARVLGGLLAALAVVAVGLGGVVYTLVQERRALVAEITREERLYTAPDARTTTAQLRGGGQVTFIASKQLNRALFIGSGLPDPGPDRYQLWTATGTSVDDLTGVVRDEQVTDPSPEVKIFFRGDIAGSDFLAVNLEPAGTTPGAPTTDVLAAVAI